MSAEIQILGKLLQGRYIEDMSEKEFFQFCQDNREFKFERNDLGQIEFMSRKTFLTGDRNGEILFQLSQWSKTN